MKHKTAKYVIEKLDDWLEDLYDCTGTFSYIERQHRKGKDEPDVWESLFNCFAHIDALKHEVCALKNMMDWWYKKPESDRDEKEDE